MKYKIIAFMFVSLTAMAGKIKSTNIYYGNRNDIIKLKDYCNNKDRRTSNCNEFHHLVFPSIHKHNLDLSKQKKELTEKIETAITNTEQNMMNHFETIVQERIKDDVESALENSTSDSSQLREIIRSIVLEEFKKTQE